MQNVVRLLLTSYLAIHCVQAALADGGTLRLSQQCGDVQVSVFTSPAVLRVGLVDLSVLVQDAETQQVRDDIAVTVRLERVEKPTFALQESATQAAATNRLFKSALFDVSQPGTWRASVLLKTSAPLESSDAVTPIELDLQIAPPPPAWLQLVPWIGWPFVLAALFVVHQRLAVSVLS